MLLLIGALYHRNKAKQLVSQKFYYKKPLQNRAGFTNCSLGRKNACILRFYIYLIINHL